MKRPRIWLRWLFLACVVVFICEYVALTYLAPRYVLRAIERVAGGSLTVDKARLLFPFTTILRGVRLSSNTSESALSIQKMVVKTRWFSIPRRAVWLDTLEIEQPALRITRTNAGAILWPTLPVGEAARRSSLAAQKSRVESLLSKFSAWRIHIRIAKIEEGSFEFIDKKPSIPFRGMVQHVSSEIGPLLITGDGHKTNIPRAGTSFAISAELLGNGGNVAPLYCSGWAEFFEKDLQASCKLEPLALSAFEPYYHGPQEIRVYSTTLQSTSQWSSRSNALAVKMQLLLDHISEGDLSVHGRSIFDVKKLAKGQEPRLSGELDISGSPNSPISWRAMFLPGNDQVQQLVARLLERGVESLKLNLWGREMLISLVPSSKAAMTDIAATAKQAEEALEILSTPPVAEKPVLVPEASAQAQEPIAASPAPVIEPKADSSASEQPPGSSSQP